MALDKIGDRDLRDAPRNHQGKGASTQVCVTAGAIGATVRIGEEPFFGMVACSASMVIENDGSQVPFVGETVEERPGIRPAVEDHDSGCARRRPLRGDSVRSDRIPPGCDGER